MAAAAIDNNAPVVAATVSTSTPSGARPSSAHSPSPAWMAASVHPVQHPVQQGPLRPAPDFVSLVAFLAGGLLVHASSVADGVDGEVARLQLRGRQRAAAGPGASAAGSTEVG